MVDLDVPTIEALADWIETSVVVSQSGHFGRDKLDSLAASELTTLPQKVSMALTVMARRAKVLGDSYPFTVTEIGVLRRTSPWANPYQSLLFLTPGSIARQTVRASETHEMGELFEDLAESALANLWGPGGAALRFGHPSKHGRPESFDQAIPWLAKKMSVEVGRGYRPPRRKDGGVDIVVWRPFADGRPGFPIALAQCTIQAETFTKTSDVDLRLWASWLALDVDPMSLLVLPGTIRAAGTEWNQLSTVVTLIERIRLMELAGRGGEPPESRAWTSETAAALSRVIGAGEL